MRSFGNFCVTSVLGSSCTTCTLRSCAPYAPINSSKYLCFERSLLSLERLRRLGKRQAKISTLQRERMGDEGQSKYRMCPGH
ncbi:MAG: hypothetical protein LBJ16_01810 [Holosporaceae bacterium]|nr:hypothetical protein [Holosporaceae bacterium]